MVAPSASSPVAESKQQATSDIVVKTSHRSVPETMQRLEAAVTAAGATVFARIDHSAGAEKAGMSLRPTQVLIFGNPKLGTPAMLDSQTAGLDLPLKVLVYADAQNATHIAYHAPAFLARTHGLSDTAEYITMMTAALGKLTDSAAAAD